MSRTNKKDEFRKDMSIFHTYLHHGIDLHNRRIAFGDVEYADGNDVDFSSIEVAIRAIDKMLDISNKPIEIHMSSYGGDAYQMLSLYDKIMESPCKFIFYGRGMIMSAATWIMACCDERYLSETATVMIHDGWCGDTEKSTDSRINSDENERLQRLLEKIFAENSYYDQKFWETVCRRDLYLTAEETIDVGLADQIVEHRKRGNFRKGVRSETFRNTPTAKESRTVVKKLFERIKLEVPRTLSIDVRTEQFEDIEEYDHSKEVMEDLGLERPNNDEQKDQT